MKFFWILIITFISIHADEVQRVDAIISDITQLRIENSSCMSQVKICSEKLKNQENKNSELSKKLAIYKNFKKREIEYKNIITKLQKSLQKKTKAFTKKSGAVICKDNNPFPKLKMKKKSHNSNISKAHTYKLIKKASIYDKLDGAVVDTWKEGVVFTSNIRAKNMIKITGYFLHRKWAKAEKEMWVKVKDTKER